MDKKRNVAIIRGPSLSKWEMQIYEPLRFYYNLLGIGSNVRLHDVSNITFPITKLPLRFGLARHLPYFTEVLFQTLGDTQFLKDFDKTIAGYDLLHSVEIRNGYTYQAIEAKRKGLVRHVTVTVYENIPFLGDAYTARRRLKDEVVKNVDHFFAANSIAEKALLAEGVDSTRISIVPQAVDANIFYPKKVSQEAIRRRLRARYGIGQNDFLVISVGRLTWEKGWYDLVRVAHSLLEYKTIRFLCVGDGPEREQITEMVQRLRISDTVRFSGNIPYKDMADVFRIADVFVLASLPTRIWNEQFGGVLIEAMATGLPIIGTLNGGIAETVGKTGGIFVPPQDFSKLAEAILRFYQSPKLRLTMGKHNRQAAERYYDTYVVARKIKEIWEKVLKK